MKSRTRPSFWRAYESFDAPTREAARRAYRLFDENPSHPSLRFKRLRAYENLWAVRISDQYRAVGERRGETVTWFWIGTHNEFMLNPLIEWAGHGESERELVFSLMQQRGLNRAFSARFAVVFD